MSSNEKGVRLELKPNRIHIRILVTVALIGGLVLPATADIYCYIDNHGVMHFTNAPTSSDYKLYLPEKKRRPVRTKQARNSLYDDIISEAANRHGVDSSLLKAMIKTESNYDPQAVSHKGAMGLMQLMPANCELFRVRDPFDPYENIMAGSTYFKQLLRRFNGKITLALAAYNAGPSAVERYQAIPPFKETKNYVEKVMHYYNAFKR